MPRQRVVAGRGRARWAAAVVALLAALGAAACGAPAPQALRFDPVELPAGVEPEVLATAGDALLVGARRDGHPALLHVAGDGAVTEVALTPATPQGTRASWYALVADGQRVSAVGGVRGGAHGNVRWSAWSGTPAAVGEQVQAFSTFGGWGAGELVAAVPTSSGPLLVGSWQSDAAGLDVAVWTTDGRSWRRLPSTGTALASTAGRVGLPVAATAAGPGVLVVGVDVVRGERRPTVWRSATGATGWTRTPLPAGGTAGIAVAAGCADDGCVVAGSVDGVLALWRSAGAGWERVAGLPVVAVGESTDLPAPVRLDGRWWLFVPGDGRPQVVDVATGAPTALAGPTGPPTAAAGLGDTAYLVAGTGADARLWVGRPAGPGGSTG